MLRAGTRLREVAGREEKTLITFPRFDTFIDCHSGDRQLIAGLIQCRPGKEAKGADRIGLLPKRANGS